MSWRCICHVTLISSVWVRLRHHHFSFMWSLLNQWILVPVQMQNVSVVIITQYLKRTRRNCESTEKEILEKDKYQISNQHVYPEKAHSDRLSQWRLRRGLCLIEVSTAFNKMLSSISFAVMAFLFAVRKPSHNSWSNRRAPNNCA